jgi:hypothetical protein
MLSVQNLRCQNLYSLKNDSDVTENKKLFYKLFVPANVLLKTDSSLFEKSAFIFAQLLGCPMQNKPKFFTDFKQNHNSKNKFYNSNLSTVLDSGLTFARNIIYY